MNKKMGLWASVLIIVIVCVVFFIINRNKNNMPDQNTNTEIQNPQDNTNLPVDVTTALNKDRTAKAGDTVALNYTGKFENGKVFDSNVLPENGHVDPFIFTLGAGQVIQGWDEGIVGMKVGEKKHLVITPDKGYGPKDYGPIPGNSTLIFDVELLDIK